MDRGQAHTLEAIVASVLLLSGLVFALQVTAVTPLSASTSSQHIENQQEATAEGVLSAAKESGALKKSVLLWRPTDRNGDGQPEFYCAGSQPFYTGAPSTASSIGCDDSSAAYSGRYPTTPLGSSLDQAFGSDAVAFNVYIGYETASGEIERQRLVYSGEPSDNAATATTYVTVYDGDPLYEPDTSADGVGPTGTVVDDSAAEFYAADVRTGSVFNVFRVEVTVWRQ